MDVQSLFEKWWFGYLIMPVLLGLLTGVYGGLVVARFMLFHQEIQRAIERISTIGERFAVMIEEPDRRRASALVYRLLEEPAAALSFQGQAAAAAAIKKLSRDLHFTLVDMHTDVRQVIESGRVVAYQGKAYSAARRVMLNAEKSLTMIRLEIGVLLFGRIGHLPSMRRFLRRSDCGDCSANCKRVL